ncbi:MAG: ribosome small subunit-dependent GTPase A, partial [Cyanobacteria bacterium 13_1_20CM_4_61_6]
LVFSRVIEEQRGLYRVAGDVEGWAEVSGRFRHEAASAADFPAVGDWVGVLPAPTEGTAMIHALLERRSVLARAAAGTTTEAQVVAANIETVFLVTALSGDLNTRRLERYLTMVWDGGAVPVVVLNKADLSEDPEREASAVRTRLPLVDVVTVSALQTHGLDALMPYVRPASTIALVGSSGVGKSTLVNRLLGRETVRVGAVSDADGRGRHTTTARQLVELPGGGLLIDTPGMRELQPWGGESAVDAAFDDVVALAAACRFTDCAHESEPGCAVRAAVESGALAADRMSHYRRLVREAAFEERKHDKAAAAETKRKWKRIHQAAKAMYRDRERH